MSETNKDELLNDHNGDGVDRRGFLKCMAWAGTGALCVIEGGVLKSYSLSEMLKPRRKPADGLSFVQISDSHMGFSRAANPDVVGTLKAAVDKINGLATPPEFMLHTGDISHLSKPDEFDTVDQILKSASPKDIFFVPGEHDVRYADGQQYVERYGKGTKGAGWYSFDKKGVHFIGLVNVLNLKAGGLGTLGGEQLLYDALQVAGKVPLQLGRQLNRRFALDRRRLHRLLKQGLRSHHQARDHSGICVLLFAGLGIAIVLAAIVAASCGALVAKHGNRAATSPAGKRRPVTSCRTSSGMPPIAEPMTGTPARSASWIARGAFSYHVDGTTRTSTSASARQRSG